MAGIAEGDENFCVEHQLIPVLSSLDSLRCWAEFNAGQLSLSPSVIKFDSGMTRLGLTREELTELLLQPELILDASPILFMSHLACADEPHHVFNTQQRLTFEFAAEQLLAVDSKIKLSYGIVVWFDLLKIYRTYK